MMVTAQSVQPYWVRLTEISKQCGTPADEFKSSGKESVLNLPRVVDQLVSGAILSYRSAHDQRLVNSDDVANLLHQNQAIWHQTLKTIFPQMSVSDATTTLAADALLMLSRFSMGGIGSALHVFQEQSISALTTSVKNILRFTSVFAHDVDGKLPHSGASHLDPQTFAVALARSSFDIAVEGLKNCSDKTTEILPVITSEIISGYDGAYNGLNALYMLSARGVRVTGTSERYISALNIPTMARDADQLILHLNHRYSELREPVANIFERVLMVYFSHAIGDLTNTDRSDAFQDPLYVLSSPGFSDNPGVKEKVIALVEQRLNRETLQRALRAWEALPEDRGDSSGFALDTLTALRRRPLREF